MSDYTIERKVLKIKTGWFKSEMRPMWCLIERSVKEDGYYVGGNYVEFDRYLQSNIILYSESKDFIKQELKNFLLMCEVVE